MEKSCPGKEGVLPAEPILASIYRVLQKFVLIVYCILRKAFNIASLGKCTLIQVRNLSK